MLKRKTKIKKIILDILDEEENRINEDFQYYPNRKRNKTSIKNENIKIYYTSIIIFFLIVIISIIIILFKINSSKQENIINNIEFNNTNLINKTDIVINETNIKYISNNASNNLSIENSTEIENNKKIIRETAIKNGLIFKNICEKGLIINNQTFIIKDDPKISVIVPVYNCESTIKRAIRSIQNQNMSEIEIIIINNFSSDKTKNIIEEMKQEDPRIKIINNFKNMGILYSRCIGVLESKGKYIITLDGDDIFLEDIFNTIYEEGEKNNFDIISFKVFDFFSENSIKDNFFTDKKQISIFQPELGIFQASDNGKIYPNHANIWSKLIKSEVYKEAANKLGKERYSYFINWNEDVIMFFVICQVAQSYKFIEKYGMFHFFSRGSSTREPNDKRMFSEILLLDLIYDFSKINYKNITIIKLKQIKTYNFFSLSNEKIKNYFISVVNKILNSKYIKENDKEDIIKIYEKDIKFNYKPNISNSSLY